jgi:hypothetical protein
MPENRIVTSRFQRRLAELFDLDTPAPVGVLAPEIVPVVVIPFRPEDLHLQDEHLFFTNLTVAGVVGEYTYCALDNPTDSGMLVIVEEIVLSKHTGVQTHWVGRPATGGRAGLLATLTSGATYCADSRVPVTATGVSGVANIYRGTDAAGNRVSQMIRLKPGVDATSPMEHLRMDYVLSPGNCLGIVEPDATNLGMSGWIRWRERRANRGELI